ncbi:hypothetical protein PoB_002718700 [Plakobranchus ocellatus]|uniref:Uncharacterized protein n=1 Tax=Plakobranchus ocellatus TaxID=259542 RepID=A0AAV4A068_9GAST|nr:hypothetical protein PoB_002718700 [Plakobranchus ocellatus]
MGSSSTPSSVSLEETDSANIPFGNMNSSDEALNVLSVSDLDSSSQAAPSKEESLIGPVAPPRMKKKSQKPSPVASPQAGASRAGVGAATATVALPIPAPPKPLPRQSSLRLSQNAGESETMSHTTLQDAPLIKFDSSESETPDSDVFDPLKMKSPEDGTSLAGVAFSSSGFENSLEGEESKKLVRSRDSRSSLNRAKAFRRESSGVPLRPSYKEDSPDNSSATPSPKKEQEQEAFDPLSEVAGLSVTGSEENPSSTGRNRREVEQERRRRSSSKLLMHEWSLDSLASLSKGPTLSLPSHHSTNPFLQQPAAVATGKQYGLYPSMQHGQGQSQLPHFHPHYSLAYAGSGPLPPPGRLPTSFLAPFNHPQTAGPAPVPPASSTPPTVRPSQKPAAPRVQSQALSHGRLLPTPASSGGGPTRRTLPPAPGSRLSMPASALMAKASSNNSHTPEASSNQQADSLNDLIGIDFGGGAQQPVHQQQQQADAPPPRLRQTKWETFD